MQLTVTFRHMDPSEALKEYAREKISRVEKYLDQAVEANVVLSVEKFRHTADVTIAAEGSVINGQEETEDMYSALDKVVDKLERQIKRQRQKSKSHKGGKRGRTKEESLGAMVEEVEAEERADEAVVAPGAAEAGLRVIRMQQSFTKPMHTEEAAKQLEVSRDSYIVYTNPDTDEINVLHRDDDGQLVLIEPIKD